MSQIESGFDDPTQPAAGPLGHAWREFDWPEDSEDKDNGAYCNLCITCKRNFIGHKRRNVCKTCANPVSPNDLEAQGDDEALPSAPPDSGQAGSGEGGARLAKMLVDDATFAGVLAECDNRKLLWLAMQTKAWMDTEILGKDAAILAEVESRLYPEYDGDKVKMTEWGWDIDGDEIRYVLDGQPSAPPDSGQAGSGEVVEEIEAHAKAVFCVGAALLRIECDEGDPFRVVYSNNPMPEPYGSAWQAYEEQAEKIVELLGAPTAEKLAAPHLATPTEPDPAPAQFTHQWDRDGERCLLCGAKDWMPGKCTGPKDPAPAQTAREWVELALKNWNDYDGADWPACMTDEDAYEIADRADRAEAEAKRLNTLVAEKEAVITAWMEKLSGQMSARMSAEAERDRLREALEKIIVAFKGEPCVAPNHPNDGYKCKFSAHPIGRKWGGYCDKHNVDLIARAALNQTTNDQ